MINYLFDKTSAFGRKIQYSFIRFSDICKQNFHAFTLTHEFHLLKISN